MTFASSPRSLSTRKFSDLEIEKYLSKKKEANIGPHFLHGVYLINLASESHSLLQASINSLIFYQQFADSIKANGTIFHLGSHKGRGLAETIDQIVISLNYVLDSSPKDTKLYLETAAGQSGTIGANLDELGQIFSRIGNKSKIGFCLDTQHIFASGYDLSKVLTAFDKSIGIKYLSVIHLNDSKSEFNSHLDRHENLGEGKIGLELLAQLINDSRLANASFILEVPGSGSGPRKVDIDKAKSLINKGL